MKKNSLKKNKKGFTIVELVIVIGVIGILSAILIPTFVGLTNNARIAAMKEECANTYTAYTTEAVDGKIEYSYSEGTPAVEKKATYTIHYAGQEKVELSKDGKFYRFESGEWKEFDVSISVSKTVNYAVEFKAGDTFPAAVDTEEEKDDLKKSLSTFNSYVVKYFE